MEACYFYAFTWQAIYVITIIWKVQPHWESIEFFRYFSEQRLWTTKDTLRTSTNKLHSDIQWQIQIRYKKVDQVKVHNSQITRKPIFIGIKMLTKLLQCCCKHLILYKNNKNINAWLSWSSKPTKKPIVKRMRSEFIRHCMNCSLSYGEVWIVHEQQHSFCLLIRFYLVEASHS